MEPTKTKVRTNTIVGVVLAILSIATVGAFLFNRFKLYRPGTGTPISPAPIATPGEVGSPCDDINDCRTGLVCNITEPGAAGVCSNPNSSTCTVSITAPISIVSGAAAPVSWTSSNTVGCWGWRNNPGNDLTANDGVFLANVNQGFIALQGSGNSHILT